MCQSLYYYFLLVYYFNEEYLFSIVLRRGMIGRVPAFQPGGTRSIPGEVSNFRFLGLDVRPDIMLTADFN